MRSAPGSDAKSFLLEKQVFSFLFIHKQWYIKQQYNKQLYEATFLKTRRKLEVNRTVSGKETPEH